MTESGPSNPPAQWYPDPGEPTRLRYWDGTAWTDHVTVGAGPRPASPRALGNAALWLAVALTVLDLLVAAFSPEGERNLIRDATTGSISFGVYDAIGIVYLPVGIAVYVVTCLWLYRCRTNVELLRPNAPQKRQALWAWFGWLTPFVAAWFPYQIVRDIGTRPRFEGHPAQRPPGLGLWWTFWLISSVVANVGLPIALSEDVELLRYSAEFDIVSGLTMAVCAFFWVRIIRYIQGDQAELLRQAGTQT